MMKDFTQNNKGYTLLFAVLVASVVLAIGISILNISKKEFLLSSSARESTSAFYSADTGLECAVYHINNFSTSSPQTASLDCVKQPLSNPTIATVGDYTFSYAPDGDEGTFRFQIRTGDTLSKSCAIVTLKLFYQDVPSIGYIPRTTIESRGYNIGWDSTNSTCSQTSPRRVERALRYTF